jgi:hypothetical protein
MNEVPRRCLTVLDEKGGILFQHESIPNILGKTMVFPVRLSDRSPKLTL